MTTRQPIVNTALIEKIVNHYSFQERDIISLRDDLMRQLTTQYFATVNDNLRLYGCQKVAQGPDAQSKKWIEDYATRTSEGIARTYEKELKNKVQSLYKSNPRGNRFYYMAGLEAWMVQRNAHKVPSIALNTLTAARKYAQDRFVQENSIEGRWVFTGPPPVCRICVRIKALGPMTFKQTQQADRALPAHPNCPHRYAQLIPKKIANCDEVWRG